MRSQYLAGFSAQPENRFAGTVERLQEMFGQRKDVRLAFGQGRQF
jgi:hypothetical protein